MIYHSEEERRVQLRAQMTEILWEVASTSTLFNKGTQKTKNQLAKLDKISCCILIVWVIAIFLTPFGLSAPKWLPVTLYLMLFSSAFTYLFIRRYLERTVE